jgi:hypothetical protein
MTKNTTKNINLDAPAGTIGSSFADFAIDEAEKGEAKTFDDFGIPIAEITEEDLNASHQDGTNLTIPKGVKAAFEAAGWYLKWARFRVGGGYDHQNMNKYLMRMKGQFVKLGVLERIDPVYASSMEPSTYKGALPNAKNEQILTKGGELALVMYSKRLADSVRETNQRRVAASMGERLKTIKNDGLSIEQYQSSTNGRNDTGLI